MSDALDVRHEPKSLAQWLEYQLSIHPREIELGLDRVRVVAGRLGLLDPTCRVVTVAGTNGKGSTVALIAGLIGDRARVGVYTSPHLWRYNERVAIDGKPARDADLVAAFEAVESARGNTALTYFEFGTLAALWLFARAGVDIAVLEVGLGGRLDAVNVVAADVAVITQIGLDHTDWLGDTRAAIAAEKAGIMRCDRPVYCGDRDPPATIHECARASGARLSAIGRDFDLTITSESWQWSEREQPALCVTPHPAVHPDNLASAIAAVRSLGYALTSDDADRACVQQSKLSGRREVVDGPIPIIYDVGHNADAVALLVDSLACRPVPGRTHVVLGMLADKPVTAVWARLATVADCLYPAGLDTITPRGLDANTLADRLDHPGPTFSDPAAALAHARRAAKSGDRIIVCGSFFTVAQARSPEDE